MLAAHATPLPDVGRRPHLWLASSDNGDKSRAGKAGAELPGRGEDLPYKVEIWDEQGVTVEQTIAVTGHGTIGYAAYYAAIREYPDRVITLRYKHQVLSRSDRRG